MLHIIMRNPSINNSQCEVNIPWRGVCEQGVRQTAYTFMNHFWRCRRLLMVAELRRTACPNLNSCMPKQIVTQRKASLWHCWMMLHQQITVTHLEHILPAQVSNWSAWALTGKPPSVTSQTVQVWPRSGTLRPSLPRVAAAAAGAAWWWSWPAPAEHRPPRSAVWPWPAPVWPGSSPLPPELESLVPSGHKPTEEEVKREGVMGGEDEGSTKDML